MRKIYALGYYIEVSDELNIRNAYILTLVMGVPLWRRGEWESTDGESEIPSIGTQRQILSFPAAELKSNEIDPPELLKRLRSNKIKTLSARR
jgi:hypothetical protein